MGTASLLPYPNDSLLFITSTHILVLTGQNLLCINAALLLHFCHHHYGVDFYRFAQCLRIYTLSPCWVFSLSEYFACLLLVVSQHLWPKATFFPLLFRNARVRSRKEIFHTEYKTTQVSTVKAFLIYSLSDFHVLCIQSIPNFLYIYIYIYVDWKSVWEFLKWSGNRLNSLSPLCPSLTAGCERNTLQLSPLCPSLPVRRAETLGGAWQWFPTWRICTDTQRRTTTSSTMERMRSYTLRTSQCQVRATVTTQLCSLKKWQWRKQTSHFFLVPWTCQ